MNVGRQLSEHRIQELLSPFVSASLPEPALATILNERQLKDISTYINILLYWNARINLTAIRDPEQIVTRHFGESLFLARVLFPNTNNSSHVAAADLGSGAGFPGLPLKIWMPEIALTLIEANHKKATFLREVVRALGLNSVEVLSCRAETITAQFNLVTLRAVEQFSKVLPVALRLLKPEGRVALLIGEEQVHQLSRLAPAVRWEASHAIPLSSSRVLSLGAKAG